MTHAPDEASPGRPGRPGSEAAAAEGYNPATRRMVVNTRPRRDAFREGSHHR